MSKIEPISEEDFKLLASWLSDSNINCWLYPEWRERRIDALIVAAMLSNKRNRIWIVMANESGAEGHRVGMVSLSQIDTKDQTAMIWFLRGCHGGTPGLMTSAVANVARTAFDRLELRSLSAGVMATNLRSQRLLERVGFRFVGRFRNGFRVAEQFVDRLAYDLLPEDLV